VADPHFHFHLPRWFFVVVALLLTALLVAVSFLPEGY
jgi:hypothetical protein